MAKISKASAASYVGRIASIGELSVNAGKSTGERAASPAHEVRFANGVIGVLDRNDTRFAAWADVLNSLHQRERPVYVELEPKTGIITNLLMPTLHAVRDISPQNKSGDMQIELHMSHAIHYLRKSGKNYKTLLAALQKSQKSGEELWVTETLDTHDIIDIQKSSLASR